VIERIEGLPDHVLGFEASGKVSGEDYEQALIPAVEAELERRDKISLLYVLGEDFDGYSTAAMWDDTKVGMRHLFDWERLAVVTDDDTYGHMIKAFGFLVPAEVRVFPLAEREAAEVWISAG
jgi:hypothetical protein